MQAAAVDQQTAGAIPRYGASFGGCMVDGAWLRFSSRWPGLHSTEVRILLPPPNRCVALSKREHKSAGLSRPVDHQSEKVVCAPAAVTTDMWRGG